MNAIINGRIVTPDAVVEGKVLVYDEKISGIVGGGNLVGGLVLALLAVPEQPGFRYVDAYGVLQIFCL